MPAKKSKVNPLESISNEEVALRGIEYANKKDAIKELEAQCKANKEILEAYVESSGRVLENGSVLAVIPHTDVDVHLRKTLRVGKTLLPEAIDVLKSSGLGECVEMVPVIREDVLERLYMEGKVPDEVIKKVYAEKSTFAFSVTLKERFTE